MDPVLSDNADIETPPEAYATESDLDLRESIALASLELRMLGEARDAPIVAGRYVLLEELGAGGMGVVRRAFDRELRRDVAMKFLRLGGRARRADEARLQREARALARLSHPNIVAVFDVRATPEAFFLAMEFVEGSTASAWAKQTPRSQREILAVYVQAARGLAAAHTAGLVHRDFKPTNVMVGHDGRARVVDFGLARAAGTAAEAPTQGSGENTGSWQVLTQPGWFMGTPAYAAPEQIRGAELGPHTDQFSFCVALFEPPCRASPGTRLPGGRRRRCRRRRGAGSSRAPGSWCG